MVKTSKVGPCWFLIIRDILSRMRKTPIIQNQYYHIYNRGTEKRKIFLDHNDYQRFLFLLYLCNGTEPVRIGNLSKDPHKIFSHDKGEQLVSIHAYSLMPNHFHLILEAKKGDTSISIFMQKLITAYTMYFNIMNERSGVLFQGKYKSIHAGTDRYIQYLFAYIHANPFSSVTQKGNQFILDIDKVMNFQYSSIKDYRSIERPENAIIDKSFFKDDCVDDESIKKYLELWLTYHSDE